MPFGHTSCKISLKHKGKLPDDFSFLVCFCSPPSLNLQMVSSKTAAQHKAEPHNVWRQSTHYRMALQHESFRDASRLRRLSPVRPTFQLIRPSQFRGFPPGTAQPPARLIGSFVPSCFAEQRQNKRKCCSGTIVFTLVSKDKRK